MRDARHIDGLDVRALFSRNGRWQAWLDVEAALAQAEADLGIIPADAAAEIARKARLELLDIDRIEQRASETGHALVALIWELDNACEGSAGGYVHWGATTANITQTAQILSVRRAHAAFLQRLGDVLASLGRLAERHADTPLAGRTHGQHAVPVTFGFKVAAWIDELCRHAERLRDCERRLFVAMLGGAGGTFASLGEQGIEVQRRLGELLGLGEMPLPARTTQDHQAEYVLTLGMLASTCAKIAREVSTLMKQEFGEVAEPTSERAVGSSTMPQKRNPRLSGDIIAHEANVRAVVPLALEAMQAEHEGDRVRVAMMRRAISEACIEVDAILSRMCVLCDGLEIFPERMRRNLELSGGAILAEMVMLRLGQRIGRQRAHEVVRAAVRDAAAQGVSFERALADHREVSDVVPADELPGLLDPARYTGLSSPLAKTQAARARATASELHAAAASLSGG